MAFVPERGDVVWIALDPRVGHEQSGHRPAVVLSPSRYNARTGLCICCPISSQVKGFPFEVLLPAGLAISGVVLSDQAKSVDWRARHASQICSLPAATITEIRRKLLALI
jgi:mRNA interferase MazF